MKTSNESNMSKISHCSKCSKPLLPGRGCKTCAANQSLSKILNYCEIIEDGVKCNSGVDVINQGKDGSDFYVCSHHVGEISFKNSPVGQHLKMYGDVYKQVQDKLNLSGAQFALAIISKNYTVTQEIESLCKKNNLPHEQPKSLNKNEHLKTVNDILSSQNSIFSIGANLEN